MSDTYNLERFTEAQQDTYRTALQEINNGRKVSHWMWFIFPQVAGLGHSSTSIYYAIKNVEEAKSYLSHPTLGKRLNEISEALLKLSNKSAHDIFGSPDDVKLLSCMTLFEQAEPATDVFKNVIEKYYNGKRDQRTIEIIKNQGKKSV